MGLALAVCGNVGVSASRETEYNHVAAQVTTLGRQGGTVGRGMDVQSTDWG